VDYQWTCRMCSAAANPALHANLSPPPPLIQSLLGDSAFTIDPNEKTVKLQFKHLIQTSRAQAGYNTDGLSNSVIPPLTETQQGSLAAALRASTSGLLPVLGLTSSQVTDMLVSQQAFNLSPQHLPLVGWNCEPALPHRYTDTGVPLSHFVAAGTNAPNYFRQNNSSGWHSSVQSSVAASAATLWPGSDPGDLLRRLTADHLSNDAYSNINRTMQYGACSSLMAPLSHHLRR
jgi:hypothetical protein